MRPRRRSAILETEEAAVDRGMLLDLVALAALVAELLVLVVLATRKADQDHRRPAPGGI
jgi:hypothetical protein